MTKTARFAAMPALSFALLMTGPAMAQTQQNSPPVAVTLPAPATATGTPAVRPAGRTSKYQYVWRHKTQYVSQTSTPDTAAALRTIAAKQPGDAVVVERAGRRYLITDPYILDHATEAHAPVEALPPDSPAQTQTAPAGTQGNVSGAPGAAGSPVKQSFNTPPASGYGLRNPLWQAQTTVTANPQTAMTKVPEAPPTKAALAQQAFEDRMTRLLDTAFLRQMAVEASGDRK